VEARAAGMGKTIVIERSRIMRKHLLPLFLVAVAAAWGLAVLPARAGAEKAPAIVGDWEGTLDAGAQGKLRVVLHVTQAKDGSLAATLDSPDQNATGIPVTTITYKEPALHFESEPIKGSYDGKMNKENAEIAGDWSQSGATLPLVFKRVK
jgi:hypothetical protein